MAKIDREELTSLRNGKQIKIVSGLDRPLVNKPIGEQTRAVRRQALHVIFANTGVISTGLSLGLPTVTLRQLTDPNETIHLNESQSSWFASINTLACPLGGLLSGYLLDRYGRKCTLYMLNIISLISWILMAFTYQKDSDAAFTQLLIARFLMGIANGVASAPASVYAAEISMPKIRGSLILGTSLSVAVGITLIYLLGFFIRDDWRLIAFIVCIYQVIALICVIPIPETPNWLITKGRIAEAKASMNYFRGLDRNENLQHPEVIAEFSILQKGIQIGVGEKKPSFLQSVKLPEVYKPLIILMTLFAFQQLSGIFVVIVYAVQISANAGVTIDPFLCAILIGLARVTTTLPMGVILEKWGRRRAAMISAAGMCFAMFLLASYSHVEWLKDIPYLPVVAIVSYIVISTLGIYTLPFFMISELFPQKVRGPASGLTVAVGMFFAFVCIKIYPSMKNTIGNDYCFVFYGIISFIAVVFVYLFLPETRGRTLLEIEEEFRDGHVTRMNRKRKQAPVEMQEIFVK